MITPGRSIAVDNRYTPYGVPVFVETTLPGKTFDRLSKLTIAQDTGGAIKGPLRADLFWGYGTEAGKAAGLMSQQGEFYMLLPRLNKKAKASP